MTVQARIFQSNAARRVLNAPKESLKTAKQTLENCQENLQTLGNLLAQDCGSGSERAHPDAHDCIQRQNRCGAPFHG